MIGAVRVWLTSIVMVTLLLGFLALKCMERTKNIFLKMLIQSI